MPIRAAKEARRSSTPRCLSAEATGRQVGVATMSLTPEQAEAHFGSLAPWVTGNGPASSARTRLTLDWEPRERSLIADIDRPDYHA